MQGLKRAESSRASELPDRCVCYGHEDHLRSLVKAT